jgi:hypothetical protein
VSAAPILQSIATARRNLWTAWRWYRRTPAPLRRPEPALRAAAIAVGIWFGGLFGLLGLHVLRATAHGAPTWPGWAIVYLTAASLALLGSALVLTRRYRVGAGMLGATLVIGQLCTAALVLS